MAESEQTVDANLNCNFGEFNKIEAAYQKIIEDAIAKSQETFDNTKHYFSLDLKVVLNDKFTSEFDGEIYQLICEIKKYLLDLENNDSFGEFLIGILSNDFISGCPGVGDFVSKLVNLAILAKYFTFIFESEKNSLVLTKDSKQKMINNLALSIIEIKTPLLSLTLESSDNLKVMDESSHIQNFNPLTIPYDTVHGTTQQEDYLETMQRYLRQTFLMLNALCIRWDIEPNINESRFSQMPLYGDNDFLRNSSVDYNDKNFSWNLSKMPLLTAVCNFSDILAHINNTENFGEDIIISGISFKKDFLKNLSQEYLLEHYRFNFDKTSQYVKQMMSIVDVCLRRLTQEQFSKTRGVKPIIKSFIQELLLPSFQNDYNVKIDYGNKILLYANKGEGDKKVFMGPVSSDYPWFYDYRIFDMIYSFILRDEQMQSTLNLSYDKNLSVSWKEFELDNLLNDPEISDFFKLGHKYSTEEKRKALIRHYNIKYFIETEKQFFDAYQFSYM